MNFLYRRYSIHFQASSVAGRVSFGGLELSNFFTISTTSGIQSSPIYRAVSRVIVGTPLRVQPRRLYAASVRSR